MRPVPLAVVMTSFEPGGTEHQMLELIRRLSPSRWHVHVACLHAQGRWFGRAVEAAQSVTEFPIYSFRRADTWRQALAFAQWCKRLRIAVVHTTDLYANIFALPAAALAGVPTRVGNRRGLNPDRTRGQLALQRAAYACAHTVVANSQAAAARLRDEHVPSRKVAVVPNGLDLRRFRPHPASTARRRVVIVANLRAGKGHDVLIDAAVEVLRRYPDAHFDLVGGGPDLTTIAARASAHGIARHVAFLGPRDDVPALLESSDIFVLPSRSESFPNAVLEAMAAGLPVVASAVGGIVELIDDGRSGLLVPAGDVPALAESLCRLMADAELGTRLAQAARADAEARYSFDRMVGAFEALYGRVT